MPRNPIDFLTGEEQKQARQNLRTYLTGYKEGRDFTGRHFESLISKTDPNVFEAEDILAVEMLSVQVPPRTIWWLLEEGRDRCRSLLEGSSPPDIPIWDADLSKSGDLWKLWDAIKDEGGLGGPVIRSKLLAAKRPHAVPIYDASVSMALGVGNKGYWAYWKNQLSGVAGEELRDALEELRNGIEHEDTKAKCRDLSVLRILDIVIWMRVHES